MHTGIGMTCRTFIFVWRNYHVEILFDTLFVLFAESFFDIIVHLVLRLESLRHHPPGVRGHDGGGHRGVGALLVHIAVAVHLVIDW